MVGAQVNTHGEESCRAGSQGPTRLTVAVDTQRSSRPLDMREGSGTAVGTDAPASPSRRRIIHIGDWPALTVGHESWTIEHTFDDGSGR